jgi:hypothetical protein
MRVFLFNHYINVLAKQISKLNKLEEFFVKLFHIDYYI